MPVPGCLVKDLHHFDVMPVHVVIAAFYRQRYGLVCLDVLKIIKLDTIPEKLNRTLPVMPCLVHVLPQYPQYDAAPTPLYQ